MTVSDLDRQAQMDTVLDRLANEYPDATISLAYSNRLELLVAVILSAQCTDERVNKVTETLFEKYPSAEAFATADQDALAKDINSITYFNQKAGYIKHACQEIIDEYGGEVPSTMEALTSLSGVGRKTANVVLHHGHDVAEGIVVDTHVQRLSRRLGLTEESTPVKIEEDLMELVPEPSWRAITHLFIEHGRAVCSARNPDCSSCILEDRCPSSKLRHDVDLASDEFWSD